MVPFLNLDPSVSGDMPARAQLGKSDGEFSGRRFDSFMSETSTAADTAADWDQAEDLLTTDGTSEPDIVLSDDGEIQIKRALPDAAAPVAVMMRPTEQSHSPQPDVPRRHAIGLDQVALPPRAAQVWAMVSDGEQPAPPPHAAVKGAALPAALATTGQGHFQARTDLPVVGAEPETAPVASEDQAISLKNTPEQVATRASPSEGGRLAGLFPSQETWQQTGVPKETSFVEPPRRDAAGREPTPLRIGAEQPVERVTTAAQGNASSANLSQVWSQVSQERLTAKVETGETVLKLADPILGLGTTASERPSTHSAQVQYVSAQSPAPEIARHAASQMAIAITQNGGKSTEIALHPEELGRVRMSLSASDTSVSLSVFADRPETVDLLRRHMDILAQEFRALGYADVQFSFAGGGQRDTHASEAADVVSEFADATEDRNETGQVTVSPDNGIDLRL